MKLWQYTTCVVLSTACLGLSAVIIYTSKRNMALQDDIQARQQQLNNSILGQQSQQIANSILQDMAASATKSDKMRALLAKHGYNIPAAPAVSPTDKAAEKSGEEK